MNVLFHTTSAIGIAILLTDTNKIESAKTKKPILLTGILAFSLGVISHGALDYVPHCYPINSKIDAIVSLLLIIAFTLLTNKKYRLISVLSFLGCIFPDVLDLSPSILNNLIGSKFPTFDKIFPWHWHNYSGSIYNGDCNVSNINNLLLLVVVAIIIIARWTDTKAMVKRG